ncbi:MAG: tripartite tricarboxylate transporter TctB family protein [Methylobacteriaceae bacterium]|nr:tripartite tricarboxylate transporter TctB family protein [Methylobacteriaceae bacterium]
MVVINRYKDIIACIALLLLSAAVYYNTGFIRVFEPNSASYINGQFFPYLLSGALCLAALIQLFNSIRELHRSPADKDSVISRGALIRIVATLVILAIYTALLSTFGFLIMSMLYVFVQVIVLSPKGRLNLPVAAVLAVVSSGAIYFLFTQVLTMVLPRPPFMPF